MKNEIGRKITSLTIMTIMFAGGMTFAFPGELPAAYAANANLFVSAENSQFSNYMAGPQVIEVVVIDPDINDTDESKGEPDVKVNGKRLRMVQATDGNWYAYFADRLQATTADQNAAGGADGQGLDFGFFCSNAIEIADDNSVLADSTFTETVGVAIDEQISGGAQGGAAGATTAGPTVTAVCGTSLSGSSTDSQNVVREQKAVNPGFGSTVATGQIVFSFNLFPFIQLYNLTPKGNDVIKYNKCG